MSFDTDSAIRELLRLYHEQAAKLLAISVADFDRFPVGVLNEIRAAFTHMARAATVANLTDDQREFECNEARGHLNRVSLDAIKIMVLARWESIDSFQRSVEPVHPLTTEEYRRLHALREERKGIALSELNHIGLSELLANYIAHFEAATEFHKSLLANASYAQTRAVAKRIRRDQATNFWLAFWFCLIGVAAGFFLAEWIDLPPFPEFIRLLEQVLRTS